MTANTRKSQRATPEEPDRDEETVGARSEHNERWFMTLRCHEPLEDEGRGLIFLLKAKSKPSSERAFGVPEAGLLVASSEQAVLTLLEFVGDEGGDEVDRGHLLGLSLLQALRGRRPCRRGGACATPSQVRRGS